MSETLFTWNFESWKGVRVFSGRAATPAEVPITAHFAQDPHGRPADIPLTHPAVWTDEKDQSKHAVLVLQAEHYSGRRGNGYIYAVFPPDGSCIVCTDEDLELVDPTDARWALTANENP